MTTMKTLLAYQKLHDNISEFFYKKCTEYMKAESPAWSYCYPGGDFDSFEINENSVTVKYRYCYADPSYYRLPLDILFEDDFYEQAKAIFDKIRQAEENRKMDEERKLLEDLKRKYEST